MFWLKEIEDKSVLFITRSFLILVYFSSAVEFLSAQSSVSFAADEFRSVGLFFLAGSFFTAIPFISRRLGIAISYNTEELSVYLVLSCFVVLCAYSFVTFGTSENASYIFLSFMACVLTQLPLAYILNKINRHEK